MRVFFGGYCSKKLQCIFQIKNEDFLIFRTVLESYSNSLMQTNGEQLILNLPGNEKSCVSLFAIGTFLCDILWLFNQIVPKKEKMERE